MDGAERWVHQPQCMQILERDGDAFHLFLDIFVHWSGEKITAVAPHYGGDLDWAEHGIDLEAVDLIFEGGSVRGRHIPHRLDSWEPCILFDFADPALTAYLLEHETIEFEIKVGPHTQRFTLAVGPAPGHELAMSLVVRDANRWVPYFLDYYLDCLACDHVYLYDHKTEDGDALRRIVRPYAERGRVTFIPWHYRWKNRSDYKQIGQIPQQAHSLNMFGRCTWIGFFDHDEFLRVPDKTLKAFLREHDPAGTDGLSFGLRWFMHKGPEALDEIGNPLLEFLHAKRDAYGRKRQKLVVSPRDVRFLRIHWLEEGKRETPVDDADIYFHHYYLQPERFAAGKTEEGAEPGDYMLGFAEPMIRAAWARRGDPSSTGSRPGPRTREDWIAHVMSAFDKAEAEASQIAADALAVPGMCGTYNRHFLNALCGFEGCRYLEVGSYKGASLSAALSGNTITTTAIENWSQFDGSRDEVEAAIAAHGGTSDVTLIERDCFDVDPAELGTFDIFYYDGDHSAESHARALEHFHPCLADRAVIIVDDWNWPQVRDGTRRALAGLDMRIVYEREIILPDADVADMPRHTGRNTWWNGICVMVVDRSAVPLSASKRCLAALPMGSRDGDPPLEVIVFSKDRACQLEALLRSVERFLDHPHRLTVLYTASGHEFERGYELTAAWFPTVTWVRETDFREDLLRLIDDAAERDAQHVMFLVDDIVFTRRFTGEGMIEHLRHDEDVLALSLRLGDNIVYCHPRQMATRPPEFLDGRRWAWRGAPGGYWNYPMSVDGNIYRIGDIAQTFSQIGFRNPNTLEATLAGGPIDRPYLICHETPYLVNLALNLVQDVFNNPHGEIPAESLNRCFLSGFSIDIAPFEGRTFDSCHIEPRISLVPHERPMPEGFGDPFAGEKAPDASAPNRDTVPVRRLLTWTRTRADAADVFRGFSREPVGLNETAAAVWALCDGKRSAGAICAALEQRFAEGHGPLERDVLATLAALKTHRLLRFRR